MRRALIPSQIDLYASLSMLVLLVCVAAAYLVRVAYRGRARHARCEADGGSVLLGKRVMEMSYWLFAPIARRLARWGLRPDVVTALAVPPGIGAGIAAAQGMLGVACVLGTFAGLCDLLDGLIARESRGDSKAGWLLDTTIDRYVDWLLLAGLAIHFRETPVLLVATLLAMLGGFMVSYASLLSRVCSVPVPRGLMRRSERAVFVLIGCGFTPFAADWLFRGSAAQWIREWPVVVGVTLVAVCANISALQRLNAARRSVVGRSETGIPARRLQFPISKLHDPKPAEPAANGMKLPRM